MKAIILAAGIGSRLAPLTCGKPKTMVKINGVPMLGHILIALRQNRVRDVVILTGYRAEQIVNYCETQHSDLNFTFVHNEDYRSTNNLYSLYLAKGHVTGDFLLMNADLVFDPGVITSLLATNTAAVAVDVGRYLEESMKITLANGRITSISKKIAPADTYGCSIDVYRFIAANIATLHDSLVETIEVRQMRNEWTEVLLDELFRSGRLIATPCPIEKNRWMEIDDFADLQMAEILFNTHLPKLKNKKIFFLDRDGTLTIGSAILPDTHSFLSKLKKKDKRIIILTNNSSRTPSEHLNRFNELGLNLTQDEVVVSTEEAVAHLKKNGMTRIFWVANPSVTKYLSEQGLILDEEHPQAVLLTYDDSIDYAKLVKLTHCTSSGIPYFATHIDLACPTEKGPVPDVGAFIQAIKATNGQSPNRTFGKPNFAIVKSALDKYGLKEEDAVVIGDRLYTDIRMAADTNVTSVLVLSGETKRENYEDSDVEADIVVPGVGTLVEYL